MNSRAWLVAVLALAVAGCAGGSSAHTASDSGSTLVSNWATRRGSDSSRCSRVSR